MKLNTEIKLDSILAKVTENTLPTNLEIMDTKPHAKFHQDRTI